MIVIVRQNRPHGACPSSRAAEPAPRCVSFFSEVVALPQNRTIPRIDERIGRAPEPERMTNRSTRITFRCVSVRSVDRIPVLIFALAADRTDERMGAGGHEGCLGARLDPNL
jgi:hypothetical protein